jgi:phosphate transport system protein
MTTRSGFDRQLTQIQEEMLLLGTMADNAIERSVRALTERDLDLARQVIADDLRINKKRYDIEDKCLELIATQQPLASDLRTIVSVLYIIVDLERMADHAEGIAKIALMLADEPPLMPYIDIPRMADLAHHMLLASLETLKDRDAARARALCNDDDQVDALYDKVYGEVVQLMIKDPKTVERATHLMWVAHNLERIADRVTNICERVVYLVEGKLEELNVSTY